MFPALPGLGAPKATPAGLQLGPAARLSALKACARSAKKLAAGPYQAVEPPAKAIIQGVDFDKVQKIRFRPEDALWRGVAGADPVAFFHLNKYSADPVDIFALQSDAGGQMMAREILYPPDYFDYGASGLDPKPLAKLGFAGFRLMESQTTQVDWLAFQGASYFRSAGQDGQYGASARGIAVNTALADGRRISPLLAILAGRERPGRDHLCPAGRPQPHRRLQIRLREERARRAARW